MKYQLAVAAIFKNEALFLREWIEFHRLVGVEHFFLYDNESTDNCREVLKPYVDDGLVTLSRLDLECCQIACYYHAVYMNRQHVRWMAFIDLDEFLFCPDGTDLRAALKPYEEYPAVGVSWRNFGTNGHEARPDGLVIENYTRRAADDFEAHRHIKSIVYPDKTAVSTTAHSFIHWEIDTPAVDENFVPTIGPFRDTANGWTAQRFCLNHYMTKSMEDWLIKRNRGRADMPVDSPEYRRDPNEFLTFDRNDVEDTRILRYAPALRQALGMSEV